LATGEDWRGLTGHVATATAAVAAAGRRFDEADAQFSKAVEIAVRFGLPFAEAETDYLWGRALLSESEHHRAIEKFDAAIEIYRRCGADQRWIERVEADKQRAAISQPAAVATVAKTARSPDILPTKTIEPSTSTRQLAALMFSDVANYTALMGDNEQNAIAVVHRHRQLIRSVVPRFNGQVLEEVGDGTLASFPSAVEAVNAARRIQLDLKDDSELRVRIGIHVGDVIFSGGKVYGDGVNVASRIHGLASRGDVLISERVFEEIRNQPDGAATFVGEKTLKNVNRPIRVYALGGSPKRGSTAS
jgi:class 3 adenylate cyclase